jgi:hypothetical protein
MRFPVRLLVLHWLLLSSLGERPIAAEDRAERRPLVALTELSARAAGVETMLRAGNWKEAGKGARASWREELDHPRPDRERLASAMALRALAEAARGEREGAICRWQAAHHLDARLQGADLSPYGAAGELLERSGPTTPPAPVEAMELVEPIVTRRRPLQYPNEVRSVVLGGIVTLSAIVDERGAVRQPVIESVLARNPVRALAVEPTAALVHASGTRNLPLLVAISVLDTFCDWRFRPATVAGEPVAYRKSIAIPFATVTNPRWVDPIDPPPERVPGPDRP